MWSNTKMVMTDWHDIGITQSIRTTQQTEGKDKMTTNTERQTELTNYRAKFAGYDDGVKKIIAKDLVSDIKAFSEYVFAGSDREGFISRVEAAQKLKAVSLLLSALTEDRAA